MVQLPFERVTPDIVFENVGVDYAGPIYIKYGHVCKPTVVKSYICVFVSLSVNLELVSDLTSEAFISTFRRYIARRGKPSLIWSDHGSNFVGAQKDFKQLIKFLEDQKTQGAISQFFLPLKESPGNSFQSVRHTLVVCGSHESRV